MHRLSQILFAVAALCLLVGASLHAAAYPHFFGQIGNVALPVSVVGTLKAMWLAESANMLGFASIFLWLAMKPKACPLPVLSISVTVLFGLAGILYCTIGNFIPAHVLVFSGVTSLAGTIVRNGKYHREEAVPAIRDAVLHG